MAKSSARKLGKAKAKTSSSSTSVGNELQESADALISAPPLPKPPNMASAAGDGPSTSMGEITIGGTGSFGTAKSRKITSTQAVQVQSVSHCCPCTTCVCACHHDELADKKPVQLPAATVTKSSTQVLEEAMMIFAEGVWSPSTQVRAELARSCGLDLPTVTKWFNNWRSTFFRGARQISKFTFKKEEVKTIAKEHVNKVVVKGVPATPLIRSALRLYLKRILEKDDHDAARVFVLSAINDSDADRESADDSMTDPSPESDSSQVQVTK